MCVGKEAALGNLCPGRAAVVSKLSHCLKATPTPAPVPVWEGTSSEVPLHSSCCPAWPPFPPNSVGTLFLAAHSLGPLFLFSAGLHFLFLSDIPLGSPKHSINPFRGFPGSPSLSLLPLQVPPKLSLGKGRGFVGQLGFSSLPVLPAQGIRLWSGCSHGMGPRTGPQ